jgi:SAM-dependent methyltransferase
MQYLLLNEVAAVCSGRILEVGAGFGRISKLVLERFHQRIEEYVLLDISNDQLYNARLYLSNNLEPSVLHTVNIKFVQCDFMDFVNTADKFDLVLAVEVLMHVLPADIEKAIDALMSLSHKDVISVDWYDEDDDDEVPKKIAPHNFLHDYPTLYNNNSLVESVKRIPLRDSKKVVPEQSLFHTVKKKEKIFGFLIR